MKATKSWTVSDALWSKVASLIPKKKREKRKKYKKKPGGGRKPMDPQKVFEAIVYVLRSGCQWKALPKEFGSASSVHKYFLEWKRKGVFIRMWRLGLAEYDEMEGIAWAWQSLDRPMVEAPPAIEAVGPNPTDQGKKWDEAQHPRGRAWNPALDSRKRGERTRCETSGRNNRRSDCGTTETM